MKQWRILSYLAPLFLFAPTDGHIRALEGFTTGLDASAGASSGSDVPIADRFAGTGRWRRPGDDLTQQRGWRIHAVRRTDGSVQAKLSLGVPGMEDVTVEAHVIGQDAFGILFDERGGRVATFNAKISADGRSGSFILGSGESGTWEHDAPTRASSEVIGTQAQPERLDP